MTRKKRFICDAMCSQLGRWLRIAGYDTIIIDTPIADKDIFQRAVQEDRLLLTRDQYFQKLDPSKKTVIYLKEDALDSQAQQLKEEIHLNWLYQPFSRCLECNHLLKKIKMPPDVPDRVKEKTDQFWACTHCHHTFWRATHTEKMEEKLKGWQKNQFIIGFGGDLMIGRMVNEYLLQGRIHAVNLANNHILDFSEEGLIETIQTLDHAGISHVGAGIDLKSARAPIIIEKKDLKWVF